MKHVTNNIRLDYMETFSAEFPKSLKTREDLTEYLTVIIFTASAHHAAVNFGQVTFRARFNQIDICIALFWRSNCRFVTYNAVGIIREWFVTSNSVGIFREWFSTSNSVGIFREWFVTSNGEGLLRK